VWCAFGILGRKYRKNWRGDNYYGITSGLRPIDTSMLGISRFAPTIVLAQDSSRVGRIGIGIGAIELKIESIEIEIEIRATCIGAIDRFSTPRQSLKGFLKSRVVVGSTLLTRFVVRSEWIVDGSHDQIAFEPWSVAEHYKISAMLRAE